MSTFQRARTQEQRDERRAHILAVARELLAERRAAEVGLNELARHVGLAKSNVLRYFDSREAVLLELTKREYTAWVDAMGSRAPGGPAELAEVMAATAVARPLLAELLSGLMTTLEHNVTAETIIEFKLAMYEQVGRFQRLLDGVLGAVGRAIAASGIPREELFVTTKLWVSDAGEGRARAAFERSLTNLGLDHLDLYLIHQPFGDYYGSWRDMEKLYAEGLTRAIGVSNFFGDRLADLIAHNDIVPAVNQIETHPFFSRADYQAYMASKGVAIESWGPFAEGKNNLFTHPTLVALGQRYGKSAAQVVLRWLIQRGVIVIPKSVRPERMAENLDVFDFALSEDDMAAVSALDTGASLFIDHHSAQTAEQFASWTLDG